MFLLEKFPTRMQSAKQTMQPSLSSPFTQAVKWKRNSLLSSGCTCSNSTPDLSQFLFRSAALLSLREIAEARWQFDEERPEWNGSEMMVTSPIGSARRDEELSPVAAMELEGFLQSTGIDLVPVSFVFAKCLRACNNL